MVLFCSIEASENCFSPSQSLGSFCLSIFREKFVYTHIFICKCVSIHIYIYICEYTFIPYKHILLRHITHTRTYTHIHTSMQCTHTCIYTHMHTHAHTYTQALTNALPPSYSGCIKDAPSDHFSLLHPTFLAVLSFHLHPKYSLTLGSVPAFAHH